jgi:hypothetical protein
MATAVDQAIIQTAYATWATAGAAVIASLIALRIAGQSAKTEEKRRKAERDEKRSAFEILVRGALGYTQNLASREHANASLMKTAILTSVKATANGIDHALLLGVTEPSLIALAIEAQTLCNMFVEQLSLVDAISFDSAKIRPTCDAIVSGIDRLLKRYPRNS